MIQRPAVRLRELTPILRRSYRRTGFRCPLCLRSFITHQVLVGSEVVEDACRQCSARALREVTAQQELTWSARSSETGE